MGMGHCEATVGPANVPWATAPRHVAASRRIARKGSTRTSSLETRSCLSVQFHHGRVARVNRHRLALYDRFA